MVYTNIPFFFNNTIEVQNSAGQQIVIVPKNAEGEFAAEYKYGERIWWTLWIIREKIPTKILGLSHGQHITLPLYYGTSQYTVEVPFSVRVIEDGKVLGFFNDCYSVYPQRSNRFTFHFGREELRRIKRGDPGRLCSNSSRWY
ncbi:MAG: hypothetical protein HZB99_04255 [Candidatus Harrisonbacteria bacterium]|nr:hypothetical protein [Candidatus Harrisonbacteria bacterium]